MAFRAAACPGRGCRRGCIAKCGVFSVAPAVGLAGGLVALLGPLWVWMVFAEAPAPATWPGGALLLTTVALHSALALREALHGQGAMQLA